MSSITIELGVGQFETFALIFIRASCILYAIPLFGETSTPLRWRILFAAVLGVFFTMSLGQLPSPAIKEPISLALAMINEVILGAMFGFAGRLFFDALIMSASIVGFQMGFGTADLLAGGDGSTHMNSFTAMHRILMMMFFLSLDLHHVFLAAIHETLIVAPVGGNFFASDRFVEHIATITASMFPIAVKLAAPVIAALLFTMAVMGMMARAGPQMNVFMMSFQVSFCLGMLVYLAMMPQMPRWLREYFQ